MAIVKLKYTRSRGAIKAHLRYVVHRPGKERERLTRELFSHNYQRVEKQRVYDRINAAPRGTVFYKMTINFHPVKEDTRKDLDLQHIASLTVREMQERIHRSIPFVATVHDGHANTDLRHIHAICLVQGRLSKEEFAKLKTLWQTATAEVRIQRRARDRVRERHRTRFLTQARVLYHYSPAKQRSRRYKPLHMQHGCFNCGYGQVGGIPKGYSFCPCCHKPLSRQNAFHLELGRSL
jgi:hypothetical protein